MQQILQPKWCAFEKKLWIIFRCWQKASSEKFHRRCRDWDGMRLIIAAARRESKCSLKFQLKIVIAGCHGMKLQPSNMWSHKNHSEFIFSFRMFIVLYIFFPIAVQRSWGVVNSDLWSRKSSWNCLFVGLISPQFSFFFIFFTGNSTQH